MADRRKTFEGKVYFVTLTVVGWIDIFTRREYVEELVKCIQFCQQKKGLQLYSYVIMSNHFHMVCSRENGTVNELLRDFKSFTSKEFLKQIKAHPKESRREWLLKMFRSFGNDNRANEEFQFWQNGSYPVEVYSPPVIQQKIDYIHWNPVKAGYVLDPQYWKHSSANPFSIIKVLEL